MNLMNDMPAVSRLDLNLFRVFDCIYRERNLTRAAAILCLSQSAVSHAVGRLRRQLGDPLFVREGQGMVPTPLADRLWPDIHAALGLLGQSVHRSQDFRPERDLQQVTLAMNEELEPSLLPRLVQGLRRQAPQLRVASVRVDRPNMRADLAAGRLDGVLDVAQPAAPELAHVALLHDDFVVVSRRSRALSLEDYLAAGHITVSSRRTGRAVEDLALARLGLTRRVELRCQHYEAACRLVADTDLLLTLPRRQAEMINTGSRGLGNVVLPLPVALDGIDLHLYWHRDREHDPASVWLRTCLRDILQGMTADGQAQSSRSSAT